MPDCQPTARQAAIIFFVPGRFCAPVSDKVVCEKRGFKKGTDLNGDDVILIQPLHRCNKHFIVMHSGKETCGREAENERHRSYVLF